VQTPPSETRLTAFTIHILSDVAFAILLFIFERLRSRLASRRPRYGRPLLVIVFAVWVLSNVAYFYFIRAYAYLFLAVSTSLIITVLILELNQFWRIGLVGADAQVTKGINYARALNMVSSSLDFLGIGASKLTEEREAFEQAINRCDRPGRHIRFLLSSPVNNALQEIARKAGVDQSAYQRKVRESLRVIADLKNVRSKNIDVRFYEEIPAFRLMFIDDEVCLTSYYILGKGDGSQLPQLHIIRRGTSQDIDSLYYGFHEYFDNIWEESSPWDFTTYLA
jgi:hypothetical protein